MGHCQRRACIDCAQIHGQMCCVCQGMCRYDGTVYRACIQIHRKKTMCTGSTTQNATGYTLFLVNLTLSTVLKYTVEQRVLWFRHLLSGTLHFNYSTSCPKKTLYALRFTIQFIVAPLPYPDYLKQTRMHCGCESYHSIQAVTGEKLSLCLSVVNRGGVAAHGEHQGLILPASPLLCITVGRCALRVGSIPKHDDKSQDHITMQSFSLLSTTEKALQ